MSGTAFDYWAISESNDHLKLAYKMSKHFGKNTTQFNELVEFLLTESSENLVKYILGSPLDRTFSIAFTPVIEGETIKTKLK